MSKRSSLVYTRQRHCIQWVAYIQYTQSKLFTYNTNGFQTTNYNNYCYIQVITILYVTGTFSSDTIL